MVLKDESPERFSDDGGPEGSARLSATTSGLVRTGSRALPAVVAVLIAMVASARAAEAFGPVGRTMASEAAAVRMLSEAIVRAVRTLGEDEAAEPAGLPERGLGFEGAERVSDSGVPDDGEEASREPRLGWQEMVRPPPVE